MKTMPSNLDYIASEAIKQSYPPTICHYCHREMTGFPAAGEAPTPRSATKDHIWPKRLRSAAHGRNGVVICCSDCNAKKGDMSPGEWVVYMAENGFQLPD